MATTTQNMTVTKGTLKTEVFEFATGDYSKFRFQVKNLDGSVPLLLDGTVENNNWQVEITDLDCTVTIQDSDTLKFDVGTINYMLSCLNTTSGEWEKLFAGNITVSAAGGGSETIKVYTEGRVGRVNVPISEVPAGVNWDIIIDSNGNYYRRNGNTYVSLGSGLNEVTYDELVDLVTGSLLVPEAKYKITDFVEFDGQPERPIIVTAGSTSQLKPDFYFYDEPSIVGRYSIENDQDECPGAITGFVITDIDNVTDYSFTIPAISPSTRTVVQVPLTNVQNKNQLLCAFYINRTLAELNQFNIPEEGCIAKLASDRGNASVLIKGQVVGMATSSKLTGANSLLVTRNYLKCRRFFSNNDNSIFYNGDKPLSLGYVYDQLIYPVIAGWYSTGSFGALKLDKKVQLESAWLTFENNSVVLNLAFYNFDTVANTPKTINVHVYE